MVDVSHSIVSIPKPFRPMCFYSKGRSKNDEITPNMHDEHYPYREGEKERNPWSTDYAHNAGKIRPPSSAILYAKGFT